MPARRFLAVFSWAIGLVALCALGGEPEHASPLSPEEWIAVENCLAIVRQCQVADGMIRIKGVGDPVWTVPYVSNFAAMALLAAHDLRSAPDDVRRVERWLLWYAANQEADGTICDRTGTLASYRSNGRRDSTDSYAATFLMAVRRYQQAIRGRPAPPVVRAARLALSAVADVTQSDGLTIAKPDYRMKYLMDNVEVYGGLTEGAALFQAVGDAKEAANARRMAAQVAAGLRGFWSPRDACFAFALDMKGRYSAGLEKPYPQGLAQLYALAHVEPRQTELWQTVCRRFKPGDEGTPVERWLMAANRCASPPQRQQLRQATLAAMLQFTAATVYVERPALAILALIDRQARFPDLPAPGRAQSR
jgi:hypothetical protein